jgi:hypothetical protein
LSDQAWDIIDQELKRKLGTWYSDIVRVIVLAYISEKGRVDKGRKYSRET